MTVTDVFNYFGGYVTVSISGRQPERFINLAMRKNIYIWNLKRVDKKITFNISVKGFFMLKPIAFRSGVRVRILKKNGFFLFLRKIRKRKLLFSLLVTAFLFLNILSSFVLDIDIIGNTKIPEEKIIHKLNEIDLKKFSLRSNIDVDRISVALRNEFNTIAWVGVYEQGTRIVIDIKERVDAPRIIEKNIPCDLVAKRAGIIESFTVENGEKSVASGQMVVKGQVLVSGTIPIKNSEEKRYVHSMGSVIAKTTYIKENEFKLYTYNKSYTGNEKRVTEIKAFGKELYKASPSPYFNSDKECIRRVAGYFEYNTYIYKEYLLNRADLKRNDAEAAAKKEIAQEFKKELSKDIIKNITFEISYKDNETGVIKATAHCLEEIAEEKEIEICPSELSVPTPTKE